MSGFTTRTAVSGLTDTVPGLSPSTSYDFEVAATNAEGTSAELSLLTVTTPATASVLPSAPLTVGDSSVGNTSVNVTWAAPATGTPPFTYLVQFALAGSGSWVNGPTVTLLTGQVTGLTASTSYDFRVFATNLAGQGPASATFTVSTLAAAVLVTWQPVGASPTAAFSNGNLTVTMNGGSASPNSLDQSCVSTVSQSSGKFSFEVTMTAVTGNAAVGLVSPSYVNGHAGSFGSDTNAVGFYPSTAPGNQPPQTVAFNNVFILVGPGNTPASDVNGATFTWCVDVTNGVFWVTGPSMQASYGATAWNDSATANPATGVGGVQIGVVGSIFIGFASSEAGAIGVLNAGSSAFTRTVPSTFPPWQGGVIVVVIPGAVTGLAVGTPGASSMPLTWVAPSTGTGPFTYTVQFTPHGGSTFTTFGTTGSLSATVTGLSSSTSYDFQVFATNSAGQGGNSNLVTASTTAPVAIPGAPSGVTVSGITSTSLTVSWVAPTTGGAPTGYQVQFKLSTAGTFTNFTPTVGGGVFTEIVSGLTAATAYNIQVFAFNGTGNGPVSTPAVNATTAAASGVGPAASSTFVTVDFTNMLSPNGIMNAVVAPQAFGVATGGLQGTPPPDYQNIQNNPNLISIIRALNIPLMRNHSQWCQIDSSFDSTGAPNGIKVFAQMASQMLPSTCTLVVGLSTASGTGNMQGFAQQVAQYWETHATHPCRLWECNNETEPPCGPGQSNDDYISDFNSMIAGIQAVNPLNKGVGPTPCYINTNGCQAALIASQNANTLGAISYHDYLTKGCGPGDDMTNAQAIFAMQSDGTPEFLNVAQTAASLTARTYASGIPNLIDEYNLGCGNDDQRAGTSVGAGFVASVTLGQSSITPAGTPVWCGIWDLGFDGENNFQLIDPSNNIYPEYYALQRLGPTMPGNMVNSVQGSTGGGLRSFATKNGTNIGVTIINSNNGNSTGTVALSHWPVNGTGNGTATLWTYPTSPNISPTGPLVTNTPGNTTTVTVTNGVTGNITVPALSLAILSIP